VQYCDLLDHLVGASEQRDWEGEAERLGRLEVDHQLELDWRLDWKLARVRALEDAIGIDRRAPKLAERVNSVGQQAADFSEETGPLDGRDTVASSQQSKDAADFRGIAASIRKAQLRRESDSGQAPAVQCPSTRPRKEPLCA
jgi:hypothetical protein